MKKLIFFDKAIYTLNFIPAVLLLFSCVASYISVEKFSFLSVLSLGVPILVIINIFFLIYWLFRKKEQLLLSFSILLLGYFSLTSFFQFRFSEEDIAEEDLSIMSYNVREFNKNKGLQNPTVLKDIQNFIEIENPDIICFQEFDYLNRKKFKQYPYSYVEHFRMKGRVIQGIFSKHPIISKGTLRFKNSANNASYIDILYKKDTIRIYNIHLESLRVKQNLKAITEEASGRLYTRLGKTFAKQQKQAELINTHRKSVSYKSIICGDFNNTQFSNVYKVIKSELNDTFDKKGTAYGRTFNFKYFPLRIDFILTDPAFEVSAHNNFDVKLSDHFPVMASIRL